MCLRTVCENSRRCSRSAGGAAAATSPLSSSTSSSTLASSSTTSSTTTSTSSSLSSTSCSPSEAVPEESRKALTEPPSPSSASSSTTRKDSVLPLPGTGAPEDVTETCACRVKDNAEATPKDGDADATYDSALCHRTQHPAYIALARTILYRFLIRPLCKFLGRSKGRRRSRRVGSPFLSSGGPYRMSPPSPVATILLVCSALIGCAEACSSRNTPKPRPPPPSARPNITFPTYTCPPSYAAWYCLNGATCFTLKIDENLLYNCECAEGFMGQRCEYKDLDGSYLPSRQRVLLETASIAGGATIAVFLVVIVCITLYLHYQRKTKERKLADIDRTDGSGRDLERRPFSRCLSIPMDRLGETDKESSGLSNKGPEYWKRFSKFSSYAYRDDGRKVSANCLMGHNNPCGDFSVSLGHA